MIERFFYAMHFALIPENPLNLLDAALEIDENFKTVFDFPEKKEKK